MQYIIIQQLLNNTKQTLKLITKNSRTVWAPYHQWGPPSLDAAATPSLRHCWILLRYDTIRYEMLF